MQKITTFLMFKSGGKAAVELYTSVFNNSKVDSLITDPQTGQLYQATFTLDGQNFMAMDGGDHFSFGEGMSQFVSCKDQAEVDYFWDKLGEGGKYSQCGWLTDRFGVSWQIIPTALGELMGDPDPAKSQRVREAMLKMTKIEVAELEKAAG
jgi:predicted 3-demethylubiquinone-9 3-methyltransferase (glyoxalase superfamily)